MTRCQRSRNPVSKTLLDLHRLPSCIILPMNRVFDGSAMSGKRTTQVVTRHPTNPRLDSRSLPIAKTIPDAFVLPTWHEGGAVVACHSIGLDCSSRGNLTVVPSQLKNKFRREKVVGNCTRTRRPPSRLVPMSTFPSSRKTSSFMGGEAVLAVEAHSFILALHN